MIGVSHKDVLARMIVMVGGHTHTSPFLLNIWPLTNPRALYAVGLDICKTKTKPKQGVMFHIKRVKE